MNNEFGLYFSQCHNSLCSAPPNIMKFVDHFFPLSCACIMGCVHSSRECQYFSLSFWHLLVVVYNRVVCIEKNLPHAFWLDCKKGKNMIWRVFWKNSLRNGFIYLFFSIQTISAHNFLYLCVANPFIRDNWMYILYTTHKNIWWSSAMRCKHAF